MSSKGLLLNPKEIADHNSLIHLTTIALYQSQKGDYTFKLLHPTPTLVHCEVNSVARIVTHTLIIASLGT